MISLHTRSRCDECARAAVVEMEPDCFLCEECWGVALASLSNSIPLSGDRRPHLSSNPLLVGSAGVKFSSCGGVEGNAITPSRIADRDGSSTCGGRIAKGVGIKPGPHDSTPNPVQRPPIPPALADSEPRLDVRAAPLSLLSHTPEASGTARKAPSGSLLGEPSRISDRASFSSVGLVPISADLDAAVSALEAQWLRCGISMNSTTFLVTHDSRNQAKSSGSSNSSVASI